MPALGVDHGRAALDQDIAETREQSLVVASVGIKKVPGEEALAGARFDDRELAGIHGLGRLRHLAPEQFGEDGMHVKAGVVVPLASDPRTRSRVIAEVGIVQGGFHEGGERQGAFPRDAGDQFLDETGMTEFQNEALLMNDSMSYQGTKYV